MNQHRYQVLWINPENGTVIVGATVETDDIVRARELLALPRERPDDPVPLVHTITCTGDEMPGIIPPEQCSCT